MQCITKHCTHHSLTLPFPDAVTLASRWWAAPMFLPLRWAASAITPLHSCAPARSHSVQSAAPCAYQPASNHLRPVCCTTRIPPRQHSLAHSLLHLIRGPALLGRGRQVRVFLRKQERLLAPLLALLAVGLDVRKQAHFYHLSVGVRSYRACNALRHTQLLATGTLLLFFGAGAGGDAHP